MELPLTTEILNDKLNKIHLFVINTTVYTTVLDLIILIGYMFEPVHKILLKFE